MEATAAPPTPITVAVADPPILTTSLPPWVTVQVVNHPSTLRYFMDVLERAMTSRRPNVVPNSDAESAGLVDTATTACLAMDCEWHDATLSLVQIGIEDVGDEKPPPVTSESGKEDLAASVTAAASGAALGVSTTPSGDPSAASSSAHRRVHVFVLDALAFSSATLRYALAPFCDKRVPKLLWDGRRDALLLKSALSLDLRGTYDLQLLEVMTRPAPTAANLARTSHFLDVPRSDGSVRVWGLKRMLESDASRCAIFLTSKCGTTMTRQDAGSSDVFLQRPVPQAVVDYAACDVAALFAIRDVLRSRSAFRGSETERAVLTGSEVYEQVYAATPEFAQRHNMLPLGVLPVAPPAGSRVCQVCKRPVASQAACPVCHWALIDAAKRDAAAVMGDGAGAVVSSPKPPS